MIFEKHQDTSWPHRKRLARAMLLPLGKPHECKQPLSFTHLWTSTEHFDHDVSKVFWMTEYILVTIRGTTIHELDRHWDLLWLLRWDVEQLTYLHNLQEYDIYIFFLLFDIWRLGNRAPFHDRALKHQLDWITFFLGGGVDREREKRGGKGGRKDLFTLQVISMAVSWLWSWIPFHPRLDMAVRGTNGKPLESCCARDGAASSSFTLGMQYGQTGPMVNSDHSTGFFSLNDGYASTLCCMITIALCSFCSFQHTEKNSTSSFHSPALCV